MQFIVAVLNTSVNDVNHTQYYFPVSLLSQVIKKKIFAWLFWLFISISWIKSSIWAKNLFDFFAAPKKWSIFQVKKKKNLQNLLFKCTLKYFISVDISKDIERCYLAKNNSIKSQNHKICWVGRDPQISSPAPGPAHLHPQEMNCNKLKLNCNSWVL